LRMLRAVQAHADEVVGRGVDTRSDQLLLGLSLRENKNPVR
jgi:hypothetical protein